MAKQDVLDAINATIAPNNIKGITAESLNNVLTMMTENAGEGGSGVVTFYTTLSGEITEEQKEKNVLAFSKYAAGVPVSVIVTNESLDSTYHPFTTAFYAESDYVLCGFPIKKSDDSFASMRFNKDGSVVMQME